MTKLVARILVIILAFSMLAGTFYYIFIFAGEGSHAHAAEQTVENDKGNITMRVAIFYDSTLTPDVRLISNSGFQFGYTDAGRIYTYQTESSLTALNVARHVNLKYNGTRYVKASSSADTTVGCYHIKVLSDENYREDEATLREAFPEYNVFSACYNDLFYVMIGQFPTVDEANTVLADIIKLINPTVIDPPPTTEPDSTEPDSTEPDSTEPDSTEPESSEPESSDPESSEPETSDPESSEPESSEPESSEPETSEPESSEPESSETQPPEPIIVPPEVVLPEELVEAVNSATVHTPYYASMIVIDPKTHNIIWSFNRDDGRKLFAIGPIQVEGSTNYMTAYHGSAVRYYDGYFECAGYNPTGYYGIRVVNLVKLENYVAGVCSAEIPTWWPVETLKAFTIAVRSFAIRTLYGHGGSYNADVCNTSCCQVFNGYGPTNDRVWRAAKETYNLIAYTPAGVCGTYYSSSTGGCTANCTDVWGSNLATYPYLKAVATPWEKYKTYSRGYKVQSVTATALYNRLEQMGYTALNGKVTKVQITATGNNTTYVTQIKFYDASGNVVTINRADRIKKALSPYVDSSNFVVAKSGDSVAMTNYTKLGFGAVNTENTTGLDIQGHPFKYTAFGRQLFYVMTKLGLKSFYDSSSEKVMTADGLKDFNMSYALDSQYYPTVIGINGEVLPDIHQLSGIATSETVTTTYVADSFTFISRGWGHGVGMSQYGIYELGNLGYDYEYILSAYYSGIKFMTYAQFIGA